MTLATIAIALHLISAALWVGGMFFAYQILRPVAGAQLEPPARLRLWAGVFSRFFPWVWIFVILLPATGYWMAFTLFGGLAEVGIYIHIMQGLGWLMILIYMHLYFAPFRRLKEFVITEQWPEAGKQLDQIRQIVAVNLSLGLIVLIVAAGRYFQV
jgi:uncharacterized membrane protein